MYSAPVISTSRPPTSLLPARTASTTFAIGHVEGAQAVRIDLDLVLPHEAAERRDLGDARHGLQVVAQIPVLVASAARPGSCLPVVSTSAY